MINHKIMDFEKPNAPPAEKSADKNLNVRPAPSEMSDEDILETLAALDEQRERIRDEREEKVLEMDRFLRPLHSVTDNFLENNSILDEETRNQFWYITHSSFGVPFHRLDDEKVMAEFGKGISLLREKGILTDEILQEASTLWGSYASIGEKLKENDSEQRPYILESVKRGIDDPADWV